MSRLPVAAQDPTPRQYASSQKNDTRRETGVHLPAFLQPVLVRDEA